MNRMVRKVGFGLALLGLWAPACGSSNDTTGGTHGSGGAAGGSGASGGTSGAAGGPSCTPKTPDAGTGCNPTSGENLPLPVCSSADPCDRPLATYPGPISTATAIPSCKTSKANHPTFDDGPPLQSPGIEGTPRYACLFDPTPSAALPLLVFFHGSGGSADSVYDSTLLRQKAIDYDLSGDAAKPGYVLLSIQGRNLHWPTDADEDGSKHDIYYRDFSSCSSNPDFAITDRQIDQLVSAGKVDPNRIYVTGWSNGARFAEAYAIARHETPSPGGNRVAAASVYSGASPFAAPASDPSCGLNPEPKSTVPVMIVSGWCDLMPCDAAQAANGNYAPGSTMDAWVNELQTVIGANPVSWLKIRGTGEVETACMPAAQCTTTIATLIHLQWPDGIATTAGGTIDHEGDMLDFLRQHPL